jgi:hypothetical protein
MVLARVATSSRIPAVVLIDGTADAATTLAMTLNNPDVADKLTGRAEALKVLGRIAATPPKLAGTGR